jgi:digeranylgeranylglycerophospholipid reductase
MPYYQIDRPAFEKWLAEPIHKNIRMDSPVEEVTKENGEWVVTTPQDSYRTRSIILADGCHFTIQKQIGMIQNRPALGPCILGIYNIPDTPKDTFTYHFYTDFAGYIWVFPKGDGTANVGIGSLSPDKTHTGRLQTLLDTFLENEYPQAHCIQKSAGILPLDGAIEKPFVGSLLACGDAAGFVHPFSGEGIQFALKSGMYAAETIRSFLDKNIDDCSSYNRRCQDEFGNALLLGNKMRHAYLWALEHMPERIPQLFKIPSQKDLIALKNGKLTTKLKLAKKFFKK